MTTFNTTASTSALGHSDEVADKETSKKLTIDDLIAYEQLNPDEKVELVDGKIVAMAGGTGRHNIIGNYFLMLIEPHLLKGGGDCFSYTHDIRVRINDYKYRYPDFLIDCSGKPVNFYAENPVIIGEVLSGSTEDVDKLTKLEEYKSISSVREIFLAYQTEKKVIVYTRKSLVPLFWKISEHTNGLIRFKSIDFAVDIDEIYKRVNLNDV